MLFPGDSCKNASSQAASFSFGRALDVGDDSKEAFRLFCLNLFNLGNQFLVKRRVFFGARHRGKTGSRIIHESFYLYTRTLSKLMQLAHS